MSFRQAARRRRGRGAGAGCVPQLWQPPIGALRTQMGFKYPNALRSRGELWRWPAGQCNSRGDVAPHPVALGH